MKYLIIVACLVCSNGLIAQFQDDFTDGDFTTNPAWMGDVTDFEVDGANRLHLNAPTATGEKYLSTPCQAINNALWEFWVNMDFNPSSSNQARIYLVSDQPDLSGTLNGYYVHLGGTADEISLYRQDGSSDTKIIDGKDGRLNTSSVIVRVQVSRDAIGNWTLKADTLGGTNYVLEGAVVDDTYKHSSFFGVFCDYTSTRSDKFYFDDFLVTGQPFTDTDAPDLINITVQGPAALDVLFNEPLDTPSAETAANYVVNNSIGSPASAQLDGSNPALVHLTFPGNFPSGSMYSITINGVEDLYGNATNNLQGNFSYLVLQYGDVVINEIMADPSPTVGLPDAEFVELANNTSLAIDLTGWKLSDATSSGTLSGTLPADSFVILCSNANQSLFSLYGKVIAVANFPSMNNDGDQLSLTDTANNIIHSVNYSDDWYRDQNKAAGGWTLERTDQFGICDGSANWIASQDPVGGTPGRKNSVAGLFPDNSGPVIAGIIVLNPMNCKLPLMKPWTLPRLKPHPIIP